MLNVTIGSFTLDESVTNYFSAASGTDASTWRSTTWGSTPSWSSQTSFEDATRATSWHSPGTTGYSSRWSAVAADAKATPWRRSSKCRASRCRPFCRCCQRRAAAHCQGVDWGGLRWSEWVGFIERVSYRIQAANQKSFERRHEVPLQSICLKA